jgi:nitrogen PTS system EIIA component
MELAAIMNRELCTILSDKNKNEVLISLIDLISKKNGFSKEKTEMVTEKILYREQLMSTGIGLGIGIPHIRYEGVSEPVIAVGIQKDGINDYASIDNNPVKIIVMILVGKDQHKQHIRILSLIVSLLKNEDIKKRLLSAQNSEEIYTIMTGAKHVS